MKKNILVRLGLILLPILIGCNTTLSEDKTNSIADLVEPKDTLFPKLFLDFYYDMGYYEYKTIYEQVIKDHPENFDENGHFIIQTENISLKFDLNPSLTENKLKYITLSLVGEKTKLDLKKGPKKEVVILTGKLKNSSIESLKLPEHKVLSSEISQITLTYAIDLLGDRYGLVPRFEEFTSFLANVETQMYWDCEEYTYFDNGNLILSELIKLFTNKYDSPVKKDSTYFSSYKSGYRIKDSDVPRYPSYGDIYEIRFLHRIRTIERSYTWQHANKFIIIKITQGLIEPLSLKASTTGIITDIKIIYAPIEQPEYLDSTRIIKARTDSLRIRKSMEMI